MPDENTELTKTNNVSPLSSTKFEPKGISELQQICKWIANSNIAEGYDIECPEDVMVVAMKGASVGLNVMQSLDEVHLIQGRPSMSAKLKIALARRHPECEYFKIVEWTDEKCVYETKRKGHEPQQYPFTIDDAKRAMPKKFKEPPKGKEWKRSNWLKYPKQMLRSRAGAGLADAVYDEIMVGLYSPEEVEAMSVGDVEIVDDDATPTESPNEKYGTTTDDTVDAEFEPADDADSDDDRADHSTQRRRLGQLLAAADDIGDEAKQWAEDAIATLCNSDSIDQVSAKALKMMVDDLADRSGKPDGDDPSPRRQLVVQWHKDAQERRAEKTDGGDDQAPLV